MILKTLFNIWRLSRQTDRLREGKCAVSEVFRGVGFQHVPEKDTEWGQHYVIYVTPHIKLPIWVDLRYVVNPSTWKAIKNKLGVSGVAIVHDVYTMEDAIAEAEYDQREH